MQIPRQLYNEGGISSVPLRRENFGLGSKFKKFVRKIIPKEVAQVAVKAAPFVAPFNPAVAGAMSGLGSFQQTGRIGSSLGRGALTYGGGQAARYLGGAGFQGNPFTGGGAFTPSGFMGGFSSPLGTETGLGKFLQDRRIARQGINIDKVRGSTEPGFAGLRTPTGQPSVISQGPMGDTMWSGQPERWSPGVLHSGAPQFPNQPPPSILAQPRRVPTVRPTEMLEKAVLPETHQRKAIENVIRRGGGADVMPVDTFTKAAKDVAGTSQEGLGTRIVEKVKSLNPLSEGFDFAKAGDTIKDLGGKALNAVFRDKDGNLDKAAIMAALVTVPTFFEARALADEAGLGENEFTEEMYNASKADSKKTYESNLGSFFEGTGYTGNLAKGGRVGFKKGTPNPYAMVGETGETVLDFYYGGDMEAFLEANKPSKARGGRVNYSGGSDYKDFLQDKKDGIIPLDKTFNEWLDDNAPDPDYDKIYAKGGLIRRNYAFGADPDEFPETGDDITIFELIKEQGIPVGEQVKDKKIDVGAKSIQLAKVTDKQRQQMQHDMPYLTSGATDLQTVYENTKAWDDEGSKGFWGMGKREAEPMTKEEFKEEMIKRGYLNIKNKSIEDFDRLKIKKGGRVKYALGTPPASEGGLGGLPIEADMRYTGGFMPYGEKEKGDDVPARLSKNEFVFTADAVRAAGGGSMQKGAQRMYNTMKMLEGQLR